MKINIIVHFKVFFVKSYIHYTCDLFAISVFHLPLLVQVTIVQFWTPNAIIAFTT